MGTRLSMCLEGPQAAAASEAVLAEVARIEAACSTWRPDSAWSSLNQARGREFSLAPEWLTLLDRAAAWSQATAGAFDPVLLPLVRAWGLREGGRTPDAATLDLARQASGSRHLRINPAAGTVRLDHPEAGIEEGGFVKGYALDLAREAARAAGAAEGFLDFGGQLLAWGRPRTVTIAHPRNRHRPAFRLRLAEASLSTSGCSERGAHLLDPRTGRPSPDWGTVSVVCASALDADVLSTALFVMGPEHGLAWAEARRIAALFQLHAGPARMTTAFQTLHPTFFSKDTP